MRQRRGVSGGHGFRRLRGYVPGGCVPAALAALAAMPAAGCVRRTLTVHTEPQGALIYLNDEEVGRSPVTVDFLWYGDYEVIARLNGYETLITHEEIQAPWYEWPGIDIFSELLYPGRIEDAREMSFALSPERARDQEEVRASAEELRRQALIEGD